MTDLTTGALLRSQLAEDLATIFAEARTSDHCLAVFNLDHFKRFNLHNGHQAGDDLLRRVAGVVGPALRSGDKLYRVGGDEFAVLMAATLIDEARAVAEHIRRCVEETLSPPQALQCGDPHCLGPSPPVTISGALLSLEHYPTIDALMHAAEEMLTTAKCDGRNRFQSLTQVS